MSAKERLVTICTARQMEAQIIQGRLENEGIPALLSYESAGVVYGITTNGLGKVKIMVPEHLVKEARVVLKISETRPSISQEQAHGKPTWFKPFCIILLIAWIVIGGGR